LIPVFGPNADFTILHILIHPLLSTKLRVEREEREESEMEGGVKEGEIGRKRER
jgi:hypothetical protein